MIVGWLVYSLLIGLLLSAAARVLEVGLHGMGRPSRWVWLVASAGTVLMPLLLVWAPVEEPAAPLAAITSLPAIEFLAVSGDDGGRWLPSLRTILLAGWFVSSVVVLLIGGVSAWRLVQRRRHWERREVDGVPVLVSERTGPAVVGVRRCEIVIPEWALSLDADRRAYMLRHEQEHASAGDPRLLLAAGLLAAAAPWNPAVWYHLRRLVIAIEIDCDRRVLAQGGDVNGYAELLLAFGQRLSNTMLPVAAFAEPRSILETRIRRMTARQPRRRVVRLVSAAAASAVVVTVAAALPVPRDGTLDALPFQRDAAETVVDTARGTAPAARVVAPAAAATRMQTDTPPIRPRLAEGPAFTPYTVAPQLKNQAVVAQTLKVLYPADLRESGVGGTVDVWFFIDENGKVLRAQVKKSSGNETLDAAALLTAEVMEFTPALNRDQAVKVWVAMPIVFRPDAGGAQNNAAYRSVSDVQSRLAPVTLPVLERSPRSGNNAPELRNKAELASALQRYYPPLLRDAGIGGVVSIVLDIDANGNVTKADIGEGSGHAALDAAALKVAHAMNFAPSQDGRPVATRLSMPITFRSQ